MTLGLGGCRGGRRGADEEFVELVVHRREPGIEGGNAVGLCQLVRGIAGASDRYNREYGHA